MPRTQPKLAFVMVGLPARGKTFIARKIARYLSWLGYRTQVFNVGSYRRARLGSHQRHSFFDPGNAAGQQARRDVAMTALDDMLGFLDEGGDIAIYDATNSTRERRGLVAARCAAAAGGDRRRRVFRPDGGIFAGEVLRCHGL